MNILIIEDERLTAEDLSDTLQSIDAGYRVLSIIGTVEEAVNYLKTQPSPDLIFSDIQLTDGLSFQIFEEVKITCPIVFCTAFDEYALQAFQANGVAYLLKPFTQAMIEGVFDKFKQLQNIILDKPNWLQPLLASLKKKENLKAVLVYIADKIKPVSIENIALFYLENEKVYLQKFDNELYKVTYTLNELEAQVGESFFRVNRQTLIHRENILEIAQYFSRKLLITPKIKHNQMLIVSKEKSIEFVEWLRG